ncbi:MAG TPA: fumarate reductase subunit FrdD [Cyclobacteriaceae bacterium]|jgi:fumarate reductase subunit D
MSKRLNTSDPLWWTFFGAGGALSALFLPVLIALFGIAIPLGLIEPPSYEKINSLMSPVLSRLVLFAVLSTSMFHWAHRFRFTLYDGLQLKRFELWIMFICYGTAIVVSIILAIILWNFN